MSFVGGGVFFLTYFFLAIMQTLSWLLWSWLLSVSVWLLFKAFVLFQINNPDMRVQILKDFVKQHFTSTQLLDYALDVEKITTSKVSFLPVVAFFTFVQGVSCHMTHFTRLCLWPTETQPHSERGWFHWCCLCGPSQDVWRLHKVNWLP